MIDTLSQINLLAVLAAVVASFFLGGLWFAIVVAKIYTIALGRENMPVQKPSALFVIGPVLCNLVAILTSAVLLRLLNIESVEGALAFGALVGIGYIMSTVQNVAINPNFPRPFLYALINAPYFIGSSLMTCVRLTLMR